jgi:MFS family permease
VVSSVIYYSTILFENQIGLPTQLSLILGGVLSIVYAMFALISFLLVEKVGRRKLFLIGTFGQGIAMFITFGCLVSGDTRSAKGAAFGLYLFIAFFGATWLPLPWLYPAELNSMAVRTQANAISTMTNWLSNFLVVQVLPTMTVSSQTYFDPRNTPDFLGSL